MRDAMIEAMARAIWAERKLLDADECEELAQAALAALEAMGAVVVPREPDDDLLEVLRAEWQRTGSLRKGFAAMIAAAPMQEGEG